MEMAMHPLNLSVIILFITLENKAYLLKLWKVVKKWVIFSWKSAGKTVISLEIKGY